MSSRLPNRQDFPKNLEIDIVPPPSGSPVNVLILLHGLGDTNVSFTKLARNLNLPETVCISLRGPNPIPALFTGSDAPAFHWGDDVLVDERRGEVDWDAGFKTATEVILNKVVGESLLKNCGYAARNILFYGFGQGGSAALQVVAASDLEFGGVISVGGGLSTSATGNKKSRTPCLVLGGSRSTVVTRSAVDRLKERFSDFEYVKWEKPEDSMPRSRDEMLPVMKFFARRLRSRAGVPDGAVEL